MSWSTSGSSGALVEAVDAARAHLASLGDDLAAAQRTAAALAAEAHWDSAAARRFREDAAALASDVAALADGVDGLRDDLLIVRRRAESGAGGAWANETWLPGSYP